MEQHPGGTRKVGCPDPRASKLALESNNVPNTSDAIWWLSEEAHSDGRKLIRYFLFYPVILGVRNFIIGLHNCQLNSAGNITHSSGFVDCEFSKCHLWLNSGQWVISHWYGFDPYIPVL